jgi:hypothetical protein
MIVGFNWTISENKKSNNENPGQQTGALDSVLDPNTHVAAFSRSIMNIAAVRRFSLQAIVRQRR